MVHSTGELLLSVDVLSILLAHAARVHGASSLFCYCCWDVEFEVTLKVVVRRVVVYYGFYYRYVLCDENTVILFFLVDTSSSPRFPDHINTIHVYFFLHRYILYRVNRKLA